MKPHCPALLMLLLVLGLTGIAPSRPEVAPTALAGNTAQQPTSWLRVTVHGEGNVGYHPSLAIHTACGVRYISYYDAGNGDLRLAWDHGYGWGHAAVDTAGDVGMYSSLVIDAAGYPHIGYYDKTQGNLKYAYQDAGGWHFEVVDSSGDVGQYPSMLLDGSGHPHISYYDATNGDLKYAAYVGSGGNCGSGGDFSCRTVDWAGDVGRYTSLALHPSGYPRISYYDYDNGDLKFAYQNASGWHTWIVDSAANVGQDTSLALSSDGVAHISYYDVSHDDLKYAVEHGAGGNCGDLDFWLCTTVDSAGDVGHDTSLAMDGSDFPHIAYYDWTQGILKYAYQDAGGWHIEAVDSTGGRHASLELCGGRPYIGYLGQEYDLRFACRAPYHLFLPTTVRSAGGRLR